MSRGMVKKRGKETKKRTPVLLYIAEGQNKTETQYLNHFQPMCKCRIVSAHGNETDPVKMLKQLKRECAELGLSLKSGDRAFCIIDSDTDVAKQSQIDAAYAHETGLAQVIMSSPCIEEWFLLHFRYSTGVHTSQSAVRELKRFCPAYSKNYNIYPDIRDKTETAIENAKRLCKFHSEQGRTPHTIDCNPSSEVYRILEFILSNPR